MAKILFEKEYDGESIVDFGRDMSEALLPEYNPRLEGLPADEYGFATGSFKVTIEWTPPARTK